MIFAISFDHIKSHFLVSIWRDKGRKIWSFHHSYSLSPSLISAAKTWSKKELGFWWVSCWFFTFLTPSMAQILFINIVLLDESFISMVLEFQEEVFWAIIQEQKLKNQRKKPRRSKRWVLASIWAIGCNDWMDRLACQNLPWF